MSIGEKVRAAYSNLTRQKASIGDVMGMLSENPQPLRQIYSALEKRGKTVPERLKASVPAHLHDERTVETIEGPKLYGVFPVKLYRIKNPERTQ